MFDRDQEEEQFTREQHGDKAATTQGIQCAGLVLRPICMATYVILTVTNNYFFIPGKKRAAFATFDAAAFAWMHSAPEDEVYSTDWQDPAEYNAAVTRWMAGFRGPELLEFSNAAKAERERYMSSDFAPIQAQILAEKKSRRGPVGPSDMPPS